MSVTRKSKKASPEITVNIINSFIYYFISLSVGCVVIA
jgi:hypothetical protein